MENNETHETIEFEDIRNFDKRMFDLETFELYLNELFLELSINGKTVPGIPKINFNKYLDNIPLFISEKIFRSLNISKSGYLSLDEFCNCLQILKSGDYKDVARIIFNIYDFDGDEKVDINDIKLLISHLPLKAENENANRLYKYQMESLEELNIIIKKTFTNENVSIDFKEFLACIDRRADVFLQLLCYLFLTIPVFEKAMELYKIKRKRMITVHYSPISVNTISTYVREKNVYGEDTKNRKSYFSLFPEKINENIKDKYYHANNDDSIITKCKKLIVSDTLFSPFSMLKFRKNYNKSYKVKKATPVQRVSTPKTDKHNYTSSNNDKLLGQLSNSPSPSDLRKKREYLNQFGINKTVKSPEKNKEFQFIMKSPEADVSQQTPLLFSNSANLTSNLSKQKFLYKSPSKKTSIEFKKSPNKLFMKTPIKEVKDIEKTPKETHKFAQKTGNTGSILNNLVNNAQKEKTNPSPIKVDSSQTDSKEQLITPKQQPTPKEQKTPKEQIQTPKTSRELLRSPGKDLARPLPQIIKKLSGGEDGRLREVINLINSPQKSIPKESFNSPNRAHLMKITSAKSQSPLKEKFNNAFLKESRRNIEIGSPTKKFFVNKQDIFDESKSFIEFYVNYYNIIL